MPATSLNMGRSLNMNRSRGRRPLIAALSLLVLQRLGDALVIRTPAGGAKLASEERSQHDSGKRADPSFSSYSEGGGAGGSGATSSPPLVIGGSGATSSPPLVIDLDPPLVTGRAVTSGGSRSRENRQSASSLLSRPGSAADEADSSLWSGLVSGEEEGETSSPSSSSETSSDPVSSSSEEEKPLANLVPKSKTTETEDSLSPRQKARVAQWPVPPAPSPKATEKENMKKQAAKIKAEISGTGVTVPKKPTVKSVLKSTDAGGVAVPSFGSRILKRLRLLSSV